MENSPDSTLARGFVFSRADRTFVAAPEPEDYIEGTQSESRRLLEEVARRFAVGSERMRLFGAIPFHADEPVRLFCTERWCEMASWPFAETEEELTSSPASSENSERDAFEATVRRALDELQGRGLRKVVLARSRDVTRNGASLPLLLARLRKLNPSGTVVSLGLPSSEPLQNSESRERASVVAEELRTLIGVTPELLVSRFGAEVRSAPLAGTTPRAKNRAEDVERAAALRTSAKDRAEHGVVVESIAQCLEPYVVDLRASSEPELLATEKLWHLRSEITGRLADARTNALALALALHPTPAVAGEPRSLALEFLRQHEGLERGFYAGAIGYMDRNGDGEWMVSIRCAELGPESARVFAGAGIVDASIAELEFAETEAKMTTMLRALGGRG